MKCSDIEELLSAYANGELSRPQREFVEEHLSRCVNCRAALADYTEVRHHLMSLRATPVRSDIKEATMSKIKAADVLKRPIQRWRRPAFITVPIMVILVALLVLHPWSASPGPRGLIAEAHAALASLQSYRVAGSITNTFDGETFKVAFEMEYVAPDRSQGKITVDSELQEFIVIGDKQYRQDLRSDRSRCVAISLDYIPSKEHTLEVLDSLTDLEKLPDEKIDSVVCIHYRGRVDIDRMVDEQIANLDPEQPGYEEILKGLEQLRNMKIEVELWIGRDDYLIRQMKNDMQVPSEDTGQWDTSSAMWKFYDFNEPITIEPPETASGELLPGWCPVDSSLKELPFSRDVTFSIGGDDPAHQQISFRITITNISEEVAKNVRVTLSTAATNDESGRWKTEIEPSSPGPVDLGPGEGETYHVTWEYDASHTSKDELARLVNLTTVLAKYTTPEGEEAVELLFPDMPYPSGKPPS